MRKESSTAFLSHWCTCHSPSIFSATRRLPSSRPSRARAMASPTSSGTAEGLRRLRSSQARSMMAWRSVLMCGFLIGGAEFGDTVGGFDTVLFRGHQGDTDAVAAGVDAVGFAGQIAARQRGDARRGIQVANEYGVIDRRGRPQKESSLG